MKHVSNRRGHKKTEKIKHKREPIVLKKKKKKKRN